MTQTLRREIRKTIEKVIREWGIGADGHDVEELANEITDEIYKLPYFNKPAFNTAQADPAWNILFGERSQEEVDERKVTEDALQEFERALRLPDSFNWYPNRKAEETAMTVLRNLVVAEYKKDKTIFAQYETWRRQPFSRGAISNAVINSYPEKFVFSWSDFEASRQGNTKQSNTNVEVDNNGIPRTY